jgi:transcriptional regulator with XRE-family HTH domain
MATAYAYFDDLHTRRQRAGLTVSELAKAAGIDRGTITRAERHHACRYETLVKLVNVLNEKFFSRNGASLSPETEISHTSRFGGPAIPGDAADDSSRELKAKE